MACSTELESCGADAASTAAAEKPTATKAPAATSSTMPGFGDLPVRTQGALAAFASFLLCGLPWIATALLAPERFERFPRPGLHEELWLSPRHWGLMAFVAVCFEPVTWLIHKHVMHGGMWWVHEDHHADTAYSRPELYRNDFFPLVFAVPSSAAACWVCVGYLPVAVASVVLGALAYGLAYLYVHEEIFHRRFGLPLSALVRRQPYMKRLATAHGVHHSHKEKAPERKAGGGDARASMGGLAFGFLYAPPRFDPALVVETQKRGEKETLWSYYGPLFGVYSACDRSPAPPRSSSKSD